MSDEKVPVYTDNGEVYAYSVDSVPVDVLGTVIEAFNSNTEAPKAGDTLQVALDKFDTFDKTITTELGAVNTKVDNLPPAFTEAKVKNTKLTGLVLNNAEPVAAADTLLAGVGKLQGQITALPAKFTQNEVRSTPLTGFTLQSGDVVATDTVLSSIGKIQGQINSLPAQFTQAQVRSTPLTGVVFTTATAIVAADTLLAAIGKLQAQITAQATTISNQATTISGHTATIATLTTRLEALEGAADAG